MRAWLNSSFNLFRSSDFSVNNKINQFSTGLLDEDLEKYSNILAINDMKALITAVFNILNGSRGSSPVKVVHYTELVNALAKLGVNSKTSLFRSIMAYTTRYEGNYLSLEKLLEKLGPLESNVDMKDVDRYIKKEVQNRTETMALEKIKKSSCLHYSSIPQKSDVSAKSVSKKLLECLIEPLYISETTVKELQDIYITFIRGEMMRSKFLSLIRKKTGLKEATEVENLIYANIRKNGSVRHHGTTVSFTDVFQALETDLEKSVRRAAKRKTVVSSARSDKKSLMIGFDPINEPENNTAVSNTGYHNTQLNNHLDCFEKRIQLTEADMNNNTHIEYTKISNQSSPSAAQLMYMYELLEKKKYTDIVDRQKLLFIIKDISYLISNGWMTLLQMHKVGSFFNISESPEMLYIIAKFKARNAITEEFVRKTLLKAANLSYLTSEQKSNPDSSSVKERCRSANQSLLNAQCFQSELNNLAGSFENFCKTSLI